MHQKSTESYFKVPSLSAFKSQNLCVVNRITEIAELEGTSRDHPIQLQPLHSAITKSTCAQGHYSNVS